MGDSTKRYNYLTDLKSNYSMRVKEAEEFSKHFSENSSNYRAELLSLFLDLSHYHIDLQRKLMPFYHVWYDEDIMIKNSQIITEILTQTIRNMDMMYSDFLEYSTKTMRITSRVGMQALYVYQRYQDMFEAVPRIDRNIFVELIKEAKQYDNNYTKEVSKGNNTRQKTRSKKEIPEKSAV
ncbi:MAG: hypothetical protein KGI33_04415 [Thaumarchaeota archaeon]|nr:hypothetical protein [Nitrososphaerota archaeon]